MEKDSTRTSIDRGVPTPEGGGERRHTAGTTIVTLSRARIPGWPKENWALISEPRQGICPLGRQRRLAEGPGGDANTSADDDRGAREELSFLGKVARSKSIAGAEKRRTARPKSKWRPCLASSVTSRPSQEYPGKCSWISCNCVPIDRSRSSRRVASGRYQTMQTRKVGKIDP